MNLNLKSLPSTMRNLAEKLIASFIFVIAVTASLFFNPFATHAQFQCGTEIVHEWKMLHDADYRNGYLLMKERVNTQIAHFSQHGYRSSIINVQVVVHVIHLGEAVGSGSNISDPQVFEAIRGMNERFRNMIGNGADMTIEFCLAKRDPNGNPTSGIIRVNGSGVNNYSAFGIASGSDPGADEMEVKNLSRWNNTSYYNIWVVHKIAGNVAAFAYYPTTYAGDGTMIEAGYMTYSSLVLAHELGHAFDLPHTFDGDNNGNSCPSNTNCATQGDRICDTPPHKRGDCGSSNPCSSTGTWNNSRYNYMSYCFPTIANGRFTTDQRTRSLAAASVTPRSILVGNSSNCGCSNNAQCDDGDPCTIDACVNSVCNHSTINDCKCKSSGASIPDISTIQDVLILSNMSGVISDLDVKVKINHAYISDLSVSLRSPDGTNVQLFQRQCGSNGNLEMIFDDDGMPMTCPAIGFVHTLPVQPLSAFNGKTAHGNWTLIISDHASQDEGSLIEWCLIPEMAECVNGSQCDDGNPCTLNECTGGICSNPPDDCNVTIAGTIISETGAPVTGVTVELMGSENHITLTDHTGAYSFDVKANGSYAVAPSKNNDGITNNGITTLDIVLIQRHILNVNPLSSPYKIIAGDVNSTGSITTLDVLLTQSVAIQTSTTFPGGKLWAFVKSDFAFSNPQHPFPFVNARTYNNLQQSAFNQNFIAVKLGDVNNSWDPLTPKAEATGSVQFIVNEHHAIKDDAITIPVKVKDFRDIAGFQFTLSWDADALSLLEIENHQLKARFGKHQINEGLLAVSWNDENGKSVTLDDGAVGFEMKFEVFGNQKNNTYLNITSEIARSEAYRHHLELLEIKPANSVIHLNHLQTAFSPALSNYLLSVQPNPFGNFTRIVFNIPNDESARITIIDFLGRVVFSHEGNFSAGEHAIVWDGKDENAKELANGIYHIRLKGKHESISTKAVLLR